MGQRGATRSAGPPEYGSLQHLGRQLASVAPRSARNESFKSTFVALTTQGALRWTTLALHSPLGRQQLTERYAGRPSGPISSFGRSRETKRIEVPSASGTVVLYAREIVDHLSRPSHSIIQSAVQH
jgi:hypothetical protein